MEKTQSHPGATPTSATPTSATPTSATPTSATPTPTTVFISKETTMRLLKDVREMMTCAEPGIYYKHSETDMLRGYALIMGPKDSLYEGGYYFFKFKFPPDYPHSPPVVEFLTNDGETRMHPNMYKNRRMCMSILNSWRGEQWSGCQTIKSVLLTIMSLLDSKPLLHEPGITEKNPDYDTYHRIIQFKNYDFCMLRLLKSLSAFKQIIADIEYHDQFYEHMCAEFRKHHVQHLARLNVLVGKHPHPESLRTTNVYQITATIHYASVLRSFQECVQLLV
jgi:ubiquitin-conjugating enzyme E2 Z